MKTFKKFFVMLVIIFSLNFANVFAGPYTPSAQVASLMATGKTIVAILAGEFWHIEVYLDNSIISDLVEVF